MLTDTCWEPSMRAILAFLAPELRNDPVCLRQAVWERLAEPACEGRLTAVWMDDGGQARVEEVLFSLPGPSREIHIRTGAASREEMRVLCLLHRLRSALLGQEPPALAVLSADPAKLRDGESMRLCRALRTGLRRLVPGACLLSEDLPERERGYLRCRTEGVMSGAEAAAEGLCVMARESLRLMRGERLEGRSAVIRGESALAAHTGRMLRRLGARPAEAAAADLVFLCDPAARLGLPEAETLLRGGTRWVFEGSLGACPAETAAFLGRHGVPVLPAVAAGAGGAVCLGTDDRWEASKRLRRAMRSLLGRILEAGGGDPCRGAYACALTDAAAALIRRGL